MSDVRWVALAEVTKPHGIRGEVRLKVYNSDSNLLHSQPDVKLARPGETGRIYPVESMREVPGDGLLVKLAGVDDRNLAETLRGMQVLLRRDAFPALEPGEFYICDMLGAEVVGPAGPLGTIEEVVSYPTADALVVRPADPTARSIEVPLVDAYVEEVSAEKRVVVVRDTALALFS